MSFESTDSSIGLIALDKNTSGKRNAGNLYAAFDEAEAGNGRCNEPRQFSTLPVEEASPKKRNLVWPMGFTLLELMLVISVILILISILLPALNSARELARVSQCAGNLKQVAAADLMYSEDNNSYRANCGYANYPFPYVALYYKSGDKYGQMYSSNMLVCYGYLGDARTGDQVNIAIRKYFKCPSDEKNFDTFVSSTQYYISYVVFLMSPVALDTFGGCWAGKYERARNRNTCKPGLVTWADHYAANRFGPPTGDKNHRKTENTAYLDGHVTSYPMGRAQQTLWFGIQQAPLAWYLDRP